MSAGVADLLDFFITDEPFMDRQGIISEPVRRSVTNPNTMIKCV